MARKPRSTRPRIAASGLGATQVLDQVDDQGRTAPAAAPVTPRPRARGAQALASRVIDYTYVTHDVIRIAIITVVIIGGMVVLSMMMR